jgi:carbon storage regulator
MLVLTRKSKQSIMIGDDIEVSVLAVMGDKVRIGIEAPRSVPVFRTEVYVDMRSREGEGKAEEAREEVERELSRLRSSGDPPSE